MVLQALLVSLLLLQTPSAPNPTHMQREGGGPPIREQELLSLVRSRNLFTEQQIIEAIQARGIAFRLTDATRKALRKDGAGPALMAVVEKAAEEVRNRTAADEAAAAAAAATPTVPKPPPLDVAGQTRLLEQARQNALDYTDKLPNFICVQITRRLVDWVGKGGWQLQDVVQTRLAYNEHKESYQVVAINDQITDRSYESLRGTISTGEFGSLLYSLFHPQTEARFDWVGPAVVGRRGVYEYDYRVRQDRSQWEIRYGPQRADSLRIVPAYHGRVSLDPETHQVLRLTLEAEDIPFNFPVRAASTALDYDYVDIAGRQFLLPSRAIVELKGPLDSSRNEILFRQYRRFTADTKLSFEDTPPR